jgi:hypothetical protein
LVSAASGEEAKGLIFFLRPGVEAESTMVEVGEAAAESILAIERRGGRETMGGGGGRVDAASIPWASMTTPEQWAPS